MTMSRRGCFKSSKHGTSPEQCAPPQGPGIHVYLFWTKTGDTYFTHLQDGEVTAEDLSIRAAQIVGITPVCHALFALYDPSSCCWYSPNHSFNSQNQSSLILHLRMRFYFRNWHGLNEEPTVSRYAHRTGTEPAGAPLLEMSSLEDPALNFSLLIIMFKHWTWGLYLIWISYSCRRLLCMLSLCFLRCIPRSFARHIARDNFLTKFRIRRVFSEFVRSFQQHTYLSTLERLAPRFGTETFPLFHLEVRSDGDGSGSYLNASRAHDPSQEMLCGQPTHEVMVSGTAGIKWRKISCRRAQENSYMENDYLAERREEGSQSRQEGETLESFCDFPEISHIAIMGANVCICRQDNSTIHTITHHTLTEARSLVSLLDGYFRLTADAHHYLCHEVAPPRVVLSEANGLHDVTG
uniref:FERM domain-containing protein n=1 Tax=Astyanax mexicanus TaxID=7994 RepID=A0A3B1K723_ASTMX